jgi:hypothetical protein
MTHVCGKKCETCSHSIGQWDQDDQMIMFYCEKNLLGDDDCLSYE